MYVYPLDKKMPDGNLFWTLPKRPPTHTVFNKKNPLHAMMIASVACLRATIYMVEIPKNAKGPRSEEFRNECAENADFFSSGIPVFKPDDEEAKEI